MVELIIDNVITNYDINEQGQIYNRKTKKFLQGHVANTGYVDMLLTINGKKRHFTLHRLVAQTFIPNPNNYEIVNHINGDKTDNSVENLEWTTASGNRLHAIKNEISGLATGQRKKLDISKDLENWRQYKDTNYFVSKDGRVWNQKTGILLKQTPAQTGYIRYSLRINNKSYSKLAHCLVIEAWLDQEIKSGYVVNHINGDKTDNNLENLEIVSKQENSLHACYVLNKNVKPIIRIADSEENFEYPSLSAAARELNITPSAIRYALKNNTKCYNSYWKYK